MSVPPEPISMKLSATPCAAQPGFGFGHDLELFAALLRRLAEDDVRFVGGLRGFAHAFDFGRRLVHQAQVDDRGAVLDRARRVLDQRERHERRAAPRPCVLCRAL